MNVDEETLRHEVADLKFQLRLHEELAGNYEGLFNDVLKRKYPDGDFIRTRASGSHGDFGNDGIVRSTGTFYAGYAPEIMKSDSVVSKMEGDYTRAKKKWCFKENFSTWCFVHNRKDGLPPEANQKLLELSKRDPSLTCVTMDPDDLDAMFKSLSLDQKEQIVGVFHPPTSDASSDMQVSDLDAVLRILERSEAPVDDTDLRPPPPDKVELNELGVASVQFLKLGMTRTPVLDRLFAKDLNPAMGDQIGEAFRSQYDQLRSDGLSPEEALWKLHEMISAGISGITPELHAAIWTVLAFFFERCEILERLAA